MDCIIFTRNHRLQYGADFITAPERFVATTCVAPIHREFVCIVGRMQIVPERLRHPVDYQLICYHHRHLGQITFER